MLPPPTPQTNYCEFDILNPFYSRVDWFMPLISEPGKLKQKDHEFMASLDYITRPVSKNRSMKILL